MENIYNLVEEINATTHFINNHIYKKYSSLIDKDITNAQDLLLITIQQAEKLTVREIAEKLDITPSGASQQISKLEQDNYVKREINEKNRREILVSLDSKGVEYFEKQEKIDQIIAERLY